MRILEKGVIIISAEQMRRLKFRQNRLPFPSDPINKKLSKGVEAHDQTLRRGHFLRLPLFLNRWSASSASFVPLLSSELWLQLSLLPLCPGSIWLWDFYLPAFVFDIMIRQHLIRPLVLIYFSGTDPGDQLKGTTHSHKISMAWFLSGLSDTRVHHSFPNYHPPPPPSPRPPYTIWTQLL